VGAGGTFAASWHANQSGSLSVRAVLDSPATNVATARVAALSGHRTAAQALTVAATPTLTLTVYRAAVASYFGPGFFGHRTACGERLTRSTVGVASRTLPCGSMVAIYYKGRELVVPVIDRGPYAKHVSWDLTMATAKALGITETVRIGALSPPPAA
jgi:rare lipoprotein A (peptidoglycan hydrolase)